jgi:bifunctional DNA-binding transcriptional regulator/antitoxin component of YhaV-PrlF toxin-antitoxin module
MSKQIGYWATHPYVRLNVKDYSEEWVGYASILKLIGLTEKERDKAFLSALFLTGSRVSEVLSLRKSNFEIRKEEGLIICRNMPLLKRYKKLQELNFTNSKGQTIRRWVTQKLEKTRKPFPILLNEPLTTILLNWLEKIPEENAYLFPSPYKEGKPLSRFWAYRFIRKLDEDVPLELRQKLGLDKPLIVEGIKVKDNLHLWLHWFRSQRACCLVSEFNFRFEDLVDYFSWENLPTVLFYAKKSWKGLAEKMLQTQIRYA